jgi:hypothetical protein
MSAKSFLLATVAGGVTLFLLGGLFYGMLLADFFDSRSAANVMRETPIWGALILGELVMAALVTLIFGRWATISTPVGGLKAGAIIGLLMAVAINLTMYAVSNIVDPTAGVVEVVVAAVRLGVAGAVIGLVLSKTA